MRLDISRNDNRLRGHYNLSSKFNENDISFQETFCSVSFWPEIGHSRKCHFVLKMSFWAISRKCHFAPEPAIYYL